MIYFSLMHCFVYVVLYHKWAVNLRGSDQDNIEGLIYVALSRIMSLIFLWNWPSNELLMQFLNWMGLLIVSFCLACEKFRFSSLFTAGNVSLGGTSATQRQKFHTDDANQCLHNKSSSHGIPNINLSSFMCLLVGFGKVLCSSANELQQNSNTSSREGYIPQILTVLLEILRVYI